MKQTTKGRFLPKVALPGQAGCMLWLGSTSRWNGYGRFYDGNRMVYAHRFAYELWVGPIPEGLQIDHLCRVRNCVCPDHLEAVTARLNTLRSNSVSALNAAKDHCTRRHPLSGSNISTARSTQGRRRKCLACDRERQRERRARLKEAEAA